MAARPVRSVRIRGRCYQYREQALGQQGALGLCDDPDSVGKAIAIDRRLKGFDRLETVIHELLHAGLWDLDEELVGVLANDYARALWRLGLRWSG